MLLWYLVILPPKDKCTDAFNSCFFAHIDVVVRCCAREFTGITDRYGNLNTNIFADGYHYFATDSDTNRKLGEIGSGWGLCPFRSGGAFSGCGGSGQWHRHSNGWTRPRKKLDTHSLRRRFCLDFSAFGTMVR